MYYPDYIQGSSFVQNWLSALARSRYTRHQQFIPMNLQSYLQGSLNQYFAYGNTVVVLSQLKSVSAAQLEELVHLAEQPPTSATKPTGHIYSTFIDLAARNTGAVKPHM
eukprot:Platyproteum_vivax@DN7711_c0_g1_i1.p1